MHPTLERRPEHPYLAIRCEITEGVPAAVDVAFPELFGGLAERGVTPSGPPFLRTRELDEDGEPLVLDVGALVAGDVELFGRVHRAALPAGRYAVVTHVGPYRHESVPDLGDARSALEDWVGEQGLSFRRRSELGWTVGCAVESFRAGPLEERDWRLWETELAVLVGGEGG